MSRDAYSSHKILRENAFIYDDYYRGGIIDGWEQHDKSYNFQHLLKIAHKAGKPLKNASVLDVGCGTGDIVPHLRAKHIKKYIGVDIYKPALKIAKKKYPGEIFLHLDILKNEPSSSRPLRPPSREAGQSFSEARKRGPRFPFKSSTLRLRPEGQGMTQKFEFVLSSGALSIKLKSVDNYAFITSMIKRMWQMSRYGLAFNLLTDEDVAPASHLFYYNIEAVRSICKEVAPNAKVSIYRTPILNGPGYEDEAQIHVYMTPLQIS